MAATMLAMLLLLLLLLLLLSWIVRQHRTSNNDKRTTKRTNQTHILSLLLIRISNIAACLCVSLCACLPLTLTHNITAGGYVDRIRCWLANGGAVVVAVGVLLPQFLIPYQAYTTVLCVSFCADTQTHNTCTKRTYILTSHAQSLHSHMITFGTKLYSKCQAQFCQGEFKWHRIRTDLALLQFCANWMELPFNSIYSPLLSMPDKCNHCMPSSITLLAVTLCVCVWM